MKRLKHSTLVLVLLLSQPIWAGKFDVQIGYFQVKASTSRGENTISNLGSYLIGYRTPFLSQYEFQVSYSLIASKTLGGDLGFGPDLGLNYFPMTRATASAGQTENVTIESSEIYRPFAGITFHQRQYQSTQSSYAGFGISIGLEYMLTRMTSVRTDLKYIRLIGPSQSTANELDLMCGLTLQLGK